MDVDFETFVLKITAHFSGNPHRTSLFKQFCEEQEVKYREFPQKADTRWLSLGKLAKCVLKMWPAIYAYFSSTDDAHSVLERAFESPEKALKYQALTAFMSYALNQFNILSYATQDTKLMVLELVETVNNFKTILSGQLRDKQYGTECGDLLEQLEDEGQRSVTKELEKSFCKFYEHSLTYMNRWFAYLDQLQEVSWLSLSDSFTYKAIDASFKKLIGKEAAARDQLYTEFVEVEKNLRLLCEKEQFTTSSLPQKWARLLK
ncbi:hypothetical protein AAVH_33170, partial [Aphelenchoides avenae]